MSALAVAVLSLVAFVVAYRYYGRFISERVLGLKDSEPMPSHQFADGVDYVPTKRAVLFGHHFASIAGAGPIVGPAVAVIFGWVPALLWAVLGSIFIGGVHDFGALVMSIRHKGRSVGDICEEVMGPRARRLFLLLIAFILAIVIAVFCIVIASLFGMYPESVFPTFFLVGLAALIGFLIYRTPLGLGPATLVGFGLMLWSVVYGAGHPMGQGVSKDTWLYVLLAYSFIASVLPVWLLLQPRDYLNSYQLYVGLALMYVGLAIAQPEITAPAIRTEVHGAPPILPFLFILIACGAVSGFHSLVSSGTTSKQLDRATDAQPVAYGSMLVEGALAVLVILACTAGLGDGAAWQARYADYAVSSTLGANLSAFVDGAGGFISHLGIPLAFAKTLVAVTVVSFAMTTLDSSARLLRFIISELGSKMNVPALDNRFVASGLAVGGAWLFATMKTGGKATGMVLWPVFGMSNQILAALGLLTLSVYLYKRRRPVVYTLVPLGFMLTMTMWAMGWSLRSYVADGNWLLVGVGGVILFLEAWLLVEGVAAWRSFRAEEEPGGAVETA